MAEYQTEKQTSGFLTFWWGMLGMFLFAVVAGLIYWVQSGKETFTDKQGAERLTKRQEIEEEQKKLMTTYGWSDEETKTVRIPVERALALAAPELLQKPVRITDQVVPGTSTFLKQQEKITEEAAAPEEEKK